MTSSDLFIYACLNIIHLKFSKNKPIVELSYRYNLFYLPYLYNL